MRNIITPNNLILDSYSGNAMKEVIQQEIVAEYNNLDDLICEITTGFGKTEIAFKVIRQNTSKIINIVVPTETLEKQWRKKLDKAGLFLSNIRIYIINSYTMNPNSIENIDPDILIVDEAHRCLGNSEYFSNLLVLTPKSKKLLLSASINNDQKRFLDSLNLFNYYVITRNWAYQKGLVPYHTPFNIPIDLTPVEMSDYLKANDVIDQESKYLSRVHIFEPFKVNPYQIQNGATILGVKEGVIYGKLKRWKGAINTRRQILYNAENKKEVVIEMLKYIKEKCFIFYKSIDACESFCSEDPLGVVYHSKLSSTKKNNVKEQNLTSFLTGEKPHMHSVDGLKEGIDVPDCKVGFRVAYEKGEKDTVQITGRLSRYDENDLEKESILFNLYVRSFMARGKEIQSKELEWLISNQSSQYNVIWFESASDAINYVKENFDKHETT